MHSDLFQKAVSLILCAVLLMGYLPSVSADEISNDTAVAEPVDPAVTEEETEPTTTPEVFENFVEYTVSADGVTLTKYFGSAKDVVIPETVNGMPVVVIGYECFYNNKKIESVVIPDSVVSIETRAFCVADNLKSVTFGTGLKRIGFNAFGGCDLQQVVLPEGLEYIDELAFSSNYYMTRINIPSTVTYIGKEAFANSWYLTEISTIPAGVTHIGTGAFLNCYELPAIWVDENNPNYSSDSQGVLYDKNQTYLYRIPGGYQGDYIMPDTVTNMAEHAGYRVGSNGALTISNNLTLIPKEAFKSSPFTALNLGTGVTTIGEGAFNLFGLMKELEIPANVTSIGDFAFQGSGDFTTVTIPETVLSLGKGVFADCEDLQSVYLPESMTVLPEKMFSKCENLVTVELPETLTKIGAEAFSKCERMEELFIPAGVVSVGDRAFEHCYNMNAIVFQGNAPEIGADAMDQMTTTCYYPAGDSTWTEAVLTNYGEYSHLTWVSYQQGTTPWNPDSQLPEGLTWSVSDDSVTITGYTGTETELQIPPMIEGCPVAYIGSNAFNNNETIVSITLPATLEKIQDYGFAYCTNLKTVTIPEGLGQIGSYAFASCSALEGIVLPQTLTSIGRNAFSNCDSLTSVAIPDNVGMIPNNLFSRCDNLSSVTLSQSASSVGAYAFSLCGKLTGIDIPARVYSVSTSAFYGSAVEEIRVDSGNPYLSSEDGVLFNKSKTELLLYPAGKLGAYTVLETVTSIGDSAFVGSHVTELILSEALETVGEYTFEECEELTSVTISKNLSSFDPMAFYGNPALTAIWVHEDNPNYSSDECGILFNKEKTELIKYPLGRAEEYTVPDGVTLIGDYAFFNSQAVTRVTLPDSLETMGIDAFTDCPNVLLRVTVDSVGERYAISDGIPYEYVDESAEEETNPPVDIPEHLNYSIVGDKVTITGYTGTADELIIPAYIEECPVRYVAANAFRGNDTLTGIVLPDTLLEIGGSAFESCEKLTYAEIPSGVTIGDWAFAWCNALQEISLPEDLTSIGESAFYDCSSLREVVIPDGVTEIPDGLFEDCVSLVSVTLPEAAERIGAAAFAGCKSLETLTIPANVLTIGMESQERAFERCNSLKAIYVHDANRNYSSDPAGVLFDKDKTDLLLCPAARTGTYTLPDTVSTIREKAFEGSALTEIILPESLQDIGEYAFAYSCITTITIPQNVRTLGWDRFEGCANLASIWVSEENENFSSDGCGVLFDKDKTTLIRMPSAYEGPYSAPEGLQYVGQNAFAQCNGPTEVVLPEGLLGIGGYAFYGSPSLTYVTLPASITDIGDAYENLFVFAESPNLIARCVISTYSANFVASEGVPYEYVDGIEEIVIATMPGKLTYAVGSPLQLSGLTLSASATNGSTITVTQGFIVDPVDMDTPGEKTVRVWWSNCSATFTITVDADLVDYPESAHPYAVNTDESWGYLHSTDAEKLLITFSEETETEAQYDFIYIFDAQENQIGKYSGTELSGQTVEVPGNSFSIRLTSDDGVCFYGFSITKVEAIGAETEPTEPETEPTMPDVGDPETEPEISEPVESEPAQVTPDGFAYEITNGVVTIIDYTGSATELIIPQRIAGCPVTGIGNGAFSPCASLVSVTVPDTIVTIGEGAFGGCSNLESITIPNSVVSIGADAFAACRNLTIRCSMDSFAATYANLFNIPVAYTDAVMSLEIATLPNQLVYPVGGLVDLTGLTLSAGFGDGSVRTITEGYSVSECDTSTAGEKTVTVSYGGLSVSFVITVDASIPVYPESDHPYGDNVNRTWTYVHNGPADELLVTFSEFTRTEPNYDWIYILDGEGSQVGDRYSDTSLAGQTITIPGNSFSVRLTSDGSVSEFFGFAVTNVEAVVYCTHDNCQWTVTQKPTFTAVGQQEAVCPDCGETVTQEIPCLEGKVDQWNVSLQDDLQVNFHLAISESIEDTARVKILVGNDAVTYRASALSKTEDGLYIVSANIAAAQMTDDIIVMVVASGNVSTSTYTVRQYADTVLADESLIQYHEMIRKMLHYGAAAQAYFDYDADMAANEGIADTEFAEVPEAVGPTQVPMVWDAAEGASFYAASLLYRNQVTLRFYFKCADDGYTFTVNGEACEVTRRDGYYIVDVEGITPENLDRSVVVDVTGENGEYLTVCYSPLNYIVRMNKKGSDSLKALLKALYNYHLAAKALRAA